MPHPLLESDSCECSHKGKVIFPSSHQNFLLVTEAGILTPSDLSKAKIIGCTNPIIKGGPCSKLVKIPDSITTNLLEVENEKAVLAECISQVLTDKGSPIILQGEPKAKGILEIEQDSKQKTKQNIQDSNSFYPYHSSYPHLASNDKNAGVEELGEGKKRESGEKTKGLMVLEIVRKWEYSPNNEDFKYWATISEFKLKLDNEIVKDSNNQEIKGYTIEPAGMNPTINKTAEEQQKTAGGDIRIPAGEYEVFWKKSYINSLALMIENSNNKETYLNDLRQTIKSLGINIEQLYCDTTTCKHNQDNRKTFGTKHIHIVPQLKPKNTNTTIIGKNRDGILIHYGDTGEWSTGCLLPANELKWKKERWIAKDRDSTINAIARLYIALIKYDKEAFKNYALGANNLAKSTIKNFTIQIKEDDEIKSYPN